MPLKPGADVGSSIRELRKGKHHKDRTERQELAIALENERKGKRKKTGRKKAGRRG